MLTWLERRESLKMIWPAVLTVALFMGAFFFMILPGYRADLLDGKKEMIRELTQTAWELVASIEERERQGIISTEEAQAMAKEHLRKMRYGAEGKDYFWINDVRPHMLMHPYRPDLEGQDVADFVDPTGKKLFLAFVDVVKEHGEGYVSYMWQWKDESGRIVPKLSYVKGFPAWGWIIGTGIYLEGVQEEIATLTRGVALISGGIGVVVALLASYVTAQALRAARRRRQAEAELREHKDQLEKTVEARTAELQGANEQLRQEVGERHRAEDKIRQQHGFLRTVIDSLPYPFYVVDVNNHALVLANSTAAEEDTWQGQTCHSLTHRQDAPCLRQHEELCPMTEVLRTAKPVLVEHLHFDRQGRERYVEVHGCPIFDEQGRIVQMIEYAIDISDRKRMERRLRQMSVTDELTGLYNRRGFMTLASKQLHMNERAERPVLLIYLDLDNMKGINDRFGHQTGDHALIETAALLQDIFRESDIIGRLGGDEFAVFLTVQSSEHSEQAVTQRLHEKMGQLNNQPGRSYALEVSMGTVLHDHSETRSIEELLSAADTLMYAHKKAKREGE